MRVRALVSRAVAVLALASCGTAAPLAAQSFDVIIRNGEFVVDEGAPTEALPGEVLRRPGARAATTSEQMPD